MAYIELHKDQNFNFQFNRLLSYGDKACDEREISKISAKTTDFESWYEQFLKYARIAESDQRYLHSMYYYRMAEFFLLDLDPRKDEMFKKMKDMFKKELPNVVIEQVEYSNAFLPSIHITVENPKGTLLVHGGYDSFLEEFYLTCLDLSEQGYNVILFEGEGQGTTLRHGLKFNYQWENTVSCILDHYNINECSLLGISWGGYFALRAAIFDKRIKNVIAYDVLYDGLDVQFSLFGKVGRLVAYTLFFLNAKNTLNKIVYKAMNEKFISKWALEHGMYITGTSTPFEFYKNIKAHSLKSICDKLEANTLLLAGENDHYIPGSHYHKLKNKLTNANVSSRLFTAAEGGEQHCQVGNYSLALDEIKSWLRDK